MSAYVVVLATPSPDGAEAMAAYSAGVQPLLAPAGAKIVVRGPVSAALAGETPPAMILVLEFVDAEAAHGFFTQDAYRKLIPLRNKGFTRLEILQVGRTC